MHVPVIDIRAFIEHSDADNASVSAARASVVQQVAAACRDVGFLVITHHGVPDATIRDAFAAAKAYFDQSADEKRRVPMTPEYPYGYECGEVLAQSRDNNNNNNSSNNESRERLADLKETFQICLGALGKTPELTPQWPPNGPAAFKPAMTAYYRALEQLASTLMQIFACALALPPTWFDDKIDSHMSSLRILNYPHQDHAPPAGSPQLRASAHTDYGSLTILAVDDAPGGLQVADLDGAWQDVQAPPGSFIVNLGDLMNRWTNETWRSTLHRVVNPPPPANGASNRRQSIAFFHCINADTVVSCIESCQSVDNPPKYAAVLAGEYLLAKHAAAQGRKAAE